MGTLFHAVRRHTVLASVIAKVRYRQPQIINCPAILIDHRITSYRPKLRPGISGRVRRGHTAHSSVRPPSFLRLTFIIADISSKYKPLFRGWRRAARHEKRVRLGGLFHEKEMPAVV